jgi:hypothetical protein
MSLARGFMVSGVSDRETDLRRLSVSPPWSWLMGLFRASLAGSSKLCSTRVGDLDAFLRLTLLLLLLRRLFWCWSSWLEAESFELLRDLSFSTPLPLVLLLCLWWWWWVLCSRLAFSSTIACMASARIRSSSFLGSSFYFKFRV